MYDFWLSQYMGPGISAQEHCELVLGACNCLTLHDGFHIELCLGDTNFAKHCTSEYLQAGQGNVSHVNY